MDTVPSLLHLPSILSSLSRFTPPPQTHAHTFMLHSATLYSTSSLVFHLGGFCPPPPPSLCLCLVHFYFLYKKAVLSCYSASVSLSVYLCPCGRLPRCLAAGGKWGHSVGDLIRWILRGDARPLAPCGPNRRSLVLLSFSSVSLCFLVSLMSFSSVYCPKDIEVGEVFLPACSLLLLTAHLFLHAVLHCFPNNPSIHHQVYLIKACNGPMNAQSSVSYPL